MSPERYAALELSSGVRIIKQGDVYWRRVRPFFYRPLFPFLRYDSISINESFRKLAACQYAVREGQPNNSFLNLITYDEIRSYDAEKLHRGPAKNLAFAIEHGLQVRRLFDDRDFCVQGYRAYLSFYNRTKYRFAKNRTDQEGFEHWAKTLSRFPELVVLGAFLGPSLVGFGIACAVEGTVIIKTAVHSDLGLELRSPDLLLHLWRLAARNDSKVRASLSYLSGPRFSSKRTGRPNSLAGYFLHDRAHSSTLFLTTNKLNLYRPCCAPICRVSIYLPKCYWGRLSYMR
jgi:hypothetical protein